MLTIQIGKGLALDVDVERFAPEVLKHVVYIGLRNILMDAHANATKKDGASTDDALALSEKKLDAMYRGEVRSTGTRTQGDLVARHMLRMAEETIKAKIKANGKNVKDYANIKDLAKQYVVKHEATLRPKAEALVADTAALATQADDDILA